MAHLWSQTGMWLVGKPPSSLLFGMIKGDTRDNGCINYKITHRHCCYEMSENKYISDTSVAIVYI
jgi:hypothetical protein